MRSAIRPKRDKKAGNNETETTRSGRGIKNNWVFGTVAF